METILNFVTLLVDLGRTEDAMRIFSRLLFPDASKADPNSKAFDLLRVLQKEDICKLMLIYINFLACKQLPVVNTTFRTPFLVMNWNSMKLDGRTADTIQRTFDKSIDVFNDLKIDILPLCYNYILLESALEKVDEARTLCQQFLQSNSTQLEFWELYATVEEVQ